MQIDSPGVYCFWHKLTSKVYVGSAKNLKTRLSQHFNNKSSNALLQRAIAKYGLEAFHICQVATDTHADALLLEQMCLNYLFANNLPKYNVSSHACGGYTTAGYTLEQKSAYISKKSGEKHHNYGKLRSDSTKQKISKARKGKPNGHLGLRRTAETCAKISKANTGKTKLSAEYIAYHFWAYRTSGLSQIDYVKSKCFTKCTFNEWLSRTYKHLKGAGPENFK